MVTTKQLSMALSTLEITECEYIIRLPRKHFSTERINNVIRKLNTDHEKVLPLKDEPELDVRERCDEREQLLRFDDLANK